MKGGSLDQAVMGISDYGLGWCELAIMSISDEGWVIDYLERYYKVNDHLQKANQITNMDWKIAKKLKILMHKEKITL